MDGEKPGIAGTGTGTRAREATMGRRATGATAAALLPAALAGAALVSAPFAGTSTAPLATSRPQAAVSAPPERQAGVSGGELATLGGAEALLLGLGIGVIGYARRRHAADDLS
jgi:hypothetical protein